MVRDQAQTNRREEDLHRREDLLHGRKDTQEGREDSRDDLNKEGISPEKISGRAHKERRPQGGISPDVISGG
jgi:hypothetical protein